MWCQQFVELIAGSANETDARRTAIPVLSQRDFGRARREVAGFDLWASYADYQSEQDGWLLGLSMSGVAAFQAPISLEAFHNWRRRTDAACDLNSLLRFAAAVVSSRDDQQQPAGTALRARLRRRGKVVVAAANLTLVESGSNA